MKKLLFLLLIIPFVFLAGCTMIGQDACSQNPTSCQGVPAGVIIKEFSPDFSEIMSGESVTFNIFMENIGGSEATGIKALLFGLNPDEWKATEPWEQDLDSLMAADPERNLAGGTYGFSWEVQSPENLRVTNPYTANIRVHYKYFTYSKATFHFITNDYLYSLPTDQRDAESKSAGLSKISTTPSAPITITITAGSRALIVYKDEEAFTFQITIKNAGGGNPFNVDASSYPPVLKDDLYKVKVKISTVEWPQISCSSLTGVTEGTITLTRGEQKTLSCIATVNKNKIATAGGKVDYTMDIDLNYGYFIDRSTSITVLKAE